MSESFKYFVESSHALLAEIHFSSYKQAFHFLEKMAVIAEEINHHPIINWNYKLVKIEIYNWSQPNTLVEIDFLLAFEIEKIIYEMLD